MKWLKKGMHRFLVDANVFIAADMAGMDIESFKEMLKMRGLKVSTYTGSKEDEETGDHFRY